MILGVGFVNFGLGAVYFLACVLIGNLMWQIHHSTPQQYSIILSKKGFLLYFLWFILVTCATVSYQNWFNDFSKYILWWRLGLISCISFICWRWIKFAKHVKEIA